MRVLIDVSAKHQSHVEGVGFMCVYGLMLWPIIKGAVKACARLVSKER